MKIVGMLRIKDEARWIDRVLRSLLPACEEVIVLDDHSTDDTVEICRSFLGVTVIESPFEGVREDRDKNFLLEKVEATGATHVIHIDGDEEIAPGGCEIIRELSVTSGPDAYRFKVLYLWNDEKTVRVDGIYRSFTRSSFFRLRKGARFHSGTSGGFHCGNVPDPRFLGHCDVKLLHYGYMHREDRIRKWHWYSGIDPTNRLEGYDQKFPERRSYPHMVQGDVPEVPADALLMHAGPLKLEPLTL